MPSCGVRLLDKGLARYSAGLRNKEVGGSCADGGREGTQKAEAPQYGVKRRPESTYHLWSKKGTPCARLRCRTPAA